MRCCAVLHTPSRPCFEGRVKEGEGGEVRWFGEEKTKPKETRRRDGRGLPGGLDRTGQDRPGPNQGEGDENQQSGGNRDRQTKIRQIR